MDNCVFNPALQTSAKLTLFKFPGVELATQSFTFPGISVYVPESPYPGQYLHQAPHTIEYDPLVLNFMISADLSNYRSIAEWLQRSLTTEQSEVFSDATVVLLDTVKRAVGSVTFTDLMPVKLGPIEYQVNVADPQPLIATAVFKYTNYKFS